MHFLLVIGLGFIVVHTISILFIKRLSYVKRISLAGIMAALVIGVPIIYPYLNKIILAVIILATLALYGYLLLFHGNSVFDDFEADDEFENIAINRPVALQEVEINNSGLSNQTSMSYSAAPQFESVTDLTQTASYSANILSDEVTQSVTYGQTATESADMTRESESALLSDMLKKLEQIDTLLTHEETQESVVEEPPVVEAVQATEAIQTARPAIEMVVEEPITVNPDASVIASPLEEMFSEEVAHTAELEEKMAGKTLAKDLHPEDVPVLTQAEEEELLDEIEHIIASQVETQNAQSRQTVDWSDSNAVHANALAVNADNTVLSAKGDDVFTLKPVDEQTLEKIREKQEEDGLISVEEQLDKELYFQFLLYESKELLMMGMYQETVDYLKEILIDSYDKNLRRNALEILESVKVELYHPQLTGNMNQEYKYLEERKVL